MMKISVISAAIVVALALSGCQTTSDPAQGGFFSGVKNLVDGTYEDRINERETNLQNEQDKHLQQSRTLANVNAQSADVRAQREAAEAKYAALQSELKTMRNRLAQAEKNNAKKKADVAALTKEIDALEAKNKMLQQDTFTPDPQKQQRLEALRREREALDREVELLIRR